ncbi:MAG: hypothetical protein ACTHN0_08050, partial [Aquihabitans sp.]
MASVRTSTVLASIAAAAVLVLSACGSSGGDAAAGSDRAAAPVTASTAAAASASDSAPANRPTGSVDRLVPVGRHGARMHLTCTGAGDRTVVLVSGFG